MISYQKLRETVTGKIVIVNIIMFVISFFCGILSQESELIRLFALQPSNFHYYQLITHQFLHGGFFHLLFNMIGLYTIGKDVEKWLGSNFLVYYLFCGVYAAFFHLSISDSTNPMVGASGAIFGLLAIWTLLNPNQYLGIIFLPFSFKAKYLTTILIVSEVLLQIYSKDNISHLAHIGGFICGVCIFFIQKFFNNR